MIVAKAVAEGRPDTGRLTGVGKNSALRRAEEFLLDRLQALALAAAGMIVLVCCLTLIDGARSPKRDELVTGSVAAQSRPPAPPAPEAWRPLRRPIETLALQSAMTDKLPISFVSARRAGGRRDQLTFGYFDESQPDMGIAVRRAETATADGLLVEVARHQAERGVAVRRAGRSERLDSKFGPLEIGDMEFAHEGGMRKACLAFRSADWPRGIGIEGWYCAAPGAAVERPVVACFVDRLTVLRAGEDQVLRQFFQDAERRRLSCPPQAQSAARKPTWLDQDGRRPSMRGEEITGSVGRQRQR
jgi:hypothetical protein